MDLEKAKQIANAQSFEGDLRVAVMSQQNALRVLLREVERLQQENTYYWENLNDLQKVWTL